METGRPGDAHAILDELIRRFEFIQDSRLSYRKLYAQRLFEEKQENKNDQCDNSSPQ
jgi:hypothetical protein